MKVYILIPVLGSSENRIKIVFFKRDNILLEIFFSIVKLQT